MPPPHPLQALLSAVTGSGSLSVVTPATAADGNPWASGTAIIAQGMLAMADPVVPTQKLWFECVAGVVVDFADSSAYVATQAPAAPGAGAQPQNCWKLKLEAGTVTWSFAQAPPVAPGAPEWKCDTGVRTWPRTGTISNFVTTGVAVPALECGGGRDAPVGALTGVGQDRNGATFALNSTTLTMAGSRGNLPIGLASTECVTPGEWVGAASSAGRFVATRLPASGYCASFKPSWVAGLLFASLVPATGSTTTCVLPTSFPTSGLQTLTMAFASPPAAAAPAGSTVVLPPPAPSTPTLSSAVAFTITLAESSGSCFSSPDALLNPCTLVALRAAYGSALKQPIGSVLLTTATVGGATISIPLSSPGNLAAAVCTAKAAACGASRALSGGARALQASASVGASVVMPSAAAASALSATVATTPAPDMTAVALAMGAASLTPTQSGATVTNVTVNVPVVVTRLNPYVPGPLIVLFHDLPRYGGASNLFNVSAVSGVIKTPQNILNERGNYLGGVAVPAVALIVVGVLFGAIYIFAYCCGCCRCCRGAKCKRDPEVYFRGIRKFCGPALAMGLMAIINFGLILSVIVYTPKFGEGITALVRAKADLTSVLVNVLTLLGTNADTEPVSYTSLATGVTQRITPVYLALKNAQTAALSASNFASTGTTTAASAIQTLLTTVHTGTGAAVAAIAAASSPLSDTKDTLTNSIDTATFDNIQRTISVAALGFFGVIAAVIFLQSSMVCKRSAACCMFKTFSLPAILLTIVIFILAGVFYLVGLLGADVCIAPAALIQGMVGTGSDLGSQTINYYLTCATTPQFPAGAITTIGEATGTLAPVVKQTGQLQAQFYDALKTGGNRNAWGSNLGTAYDNAQTAAKGAASPPPECGIPHPVVPPPAGGGVATQLPVMCDDSTTPQTKADPINRISVNMALALNSVNMVASDALSCATFDAIFSRMFDGLCNGTVQSAAGIARILIAAGVLLLLQLGIGVDLCCYRADARARALFAAPAARLTPPPPPPLSDPGDKRSWVGDDDAAQVASSTAHVGDGKHASGSAV